MRWVKIYDTLLEWRWSHKPEYVAFAIRCILRANPTLKKWETLDIPRGSFITSRELFSKEVGISERTYRTIIKHLEDCDFLRTKTTKQGTIITLCNYERYQEVKIKNDQQSTDNRPNNDQKPTDNRPNNDQKPTTIIEYIDNKNLSNEDLKDSFFKKAEDKKKSFQIPQSIEELKEMLSKEKIYMTEQGYAKFFELNQDERYGFKGGVANTARKFLKREENAVYRSFPPNSARPPQAAAQNKPTKPQPDPQVVLVWETIKADLREQLSTKDFNTWIKPIQPVKVDNDTFTICVPSPFFYEYIEDNLLEPIKMALNNQHIKDLIYVINK